MAALKASNAAISSCIARRASGEADGLFGLFHGFPFNVIPDAPKA
ncbi:MAG: hypothetical protein WDM92_07430 [Caulobacteraceae bacterium]